MTEKILLSICIPTRNQPSELKNTLENILMQSTPQIEIIIGDQSTNKDTAIMMHNNFLTIPQIHYFQNTTTQGIDNNILFVTDYAHGEYLWWFGDDMMEEGAIAHVIEIIKKYPRLALLWVNFYDWNRAGRAVNYKNDMLFDDKNSFLETILGNISFASSIVFKKSAILNIDKNHMKQFIGSGLINLYIPLHILSKSNMFYYIAHPYIRANATPPGKGSYDGFQVFAINFFRVCQAFKSKFKRRSLRKIHKRNLHHIWRAIIVFRAKGYPYSALPHRKQVFLLFKFYWTFLEFWLALPFLLMPLSFQKILYRIYKIHLI